MIAHLQGKIIKKTDRGIILEAGNVGYFVHLPITLLTEKNENSQEAFFIHTHVREDALDLYGFSTFEQLTFFKKLIGISGIGPKTALDILGVPQEKIKEAIINEDLEFIRTVHGIGPKTAKRIILELKGTIADEERIPGRLSTNNDVIEALSKLGYQKNQIIQTLERLPAEIKEPEEIIKYFLKNT